MKKADKKVLNQDKPFNTQQEVKNHIIDKFAIHGHRVKYQFKISELR